MKIQSHDVSKFKVVDIQGPIHERDTVEFRRHLNRLFDGGSRHVVLNLSETNAVCSYAVGIVVTLWKKLTQSDGALDLIIGNPTVLATFKNMSLHTIIKIFDSEDEFVSAASERGKDEYSPTVRDKGRFKILDVHEPLNIFCGYQDLDDALSSLLAQGHTKVALNVTGIAHLYSEVIGVMIRWVKRMAQAKGEFCLVGLSEDLRERLGHLQLDRVIPCRDSEDEIA